MPVEKGGECLFRGDLPVTREFAGLLPSRSVRICLDPGGRGHEHQADAQQDEDTGPDPGGQGKDIAHDADDLQDQPRGAQVPDGYAPYPRASAGSVSFSHTGRLRGQGGKHEP